MATHSCILAWEIPWTEESGGLQRTGQQRVRHDWVVTHAVAVGYRWTSYLIEEKMLLQVEDYQKP